MNTDLSQSPAGSPAAPLDAAQLAEAFALFSRASEELSTAYNALQAQVGQTRLVLTEGPRLARTEHFTEVAFDRDMPEGALVEVAITGHDGMRLRADASRPA